MRLLKMLAVPSLTLAALVAPVGAPMVANAATTVVTRVHGPLKILPHHRHKYCRTHWNRHHRVTKCWYH